MKTKKTLRVYITRKQHDFIKKTATTNKISMGETFSKLAKNHRDVKDTSDFSMFDHDRVQVKLKVDSNIIDRIKKDSFSSGLKTLSKLSRNIITASMRRYNISLK